MNNVYVFLLLLVTFVLGLIVGETYAPISGLTPIALAERCAVLEMRTAALSLRYESLAADLADAGVR